MGVAHTDQVPLIHHHQGEGTFEAGQHLEERPLELAVVGASVLDAQGDGLQHQLRVARSRLGSDPAGQLQSVGEVAVVPEGQTGRSHLPEGRLGVVPGGRAGGRVAGVSDPQVTGQAGQDLLVEDLRHQAHVLEHGHGLAVGHRDPGALLPAVLQSEETVGDQMGCVRLGGVDAEDAARFAGSVPGGGGRWTQSGAIVGRLRGRGSPTPDRFCNRASHRSPFVPAAPASPPAEEDEGKETRRPSRPFVAGSPGTRTGSLGRGGRRRTVRGAAGLPRSDRFGWRVPQPPRPGSRGGWVRRWRR